MRTDSDRTIYVVETAASRFIASSWRLVKHGIFALCVAAALGLAALNVAAWRNDLAKTADSDQVSASTAAGLAGAAPASFAAAASGGPCFLEVRVGSKTGRLLYKGVLERGKSVRFIEDRLWVRMGATRNLAVRLDGKVVSNLPVPNGDVLLTDQGIRPAPSS